MKNVPPDEWLCEDVFAWMKENGFETYANLFANHHKIDGKVLLNLTEHDLRERPLQLEVLGDIKRLSNAINLLKLQIVRNAFSPEQQSKSTLHHVEPCNNDGPSPPRLSPKEKHHESSNGFHHVENGGIVEIVNGGIIVNNAADENLPHFTTSLRRTESGSDFFIHKIESEDTKTKSIIKTAMAAVYCSSVFLLTSFVMVIVHDRVPDMKTYPPLPDLVLDSIPLIPWAFEVCEMLACILGVVWCLVVVFHKHRLILLRRMFSLTGTVFMLRCVTMLITSLSVPGVHLECTSQSYGDVYAKLRQAFRIWYGMGMSLRGVRTCGDYMFSGHTTAVTLLNHFVTEYTPDGWHYLHTASWVMNLFSIFFILAGHEHYSIDVFVAFYISSRLFLYYHSMAYHARSVTSADSRTRIWFPLFWFFESGGHVGRVKNEYEIPLPSLASIQSVFSKVLSIFSAFDHHEELKPSDVSPNHHQYDHHKQKGVKFSIGGGGADKEHVKKHKTKNGKVKSS